MKQKHEILFLNSNRTYVRVEDTWFDSSRELQPEIGNSFLLGNIAEVLSYKEYTERFPESQTELYPRISEKTNSGGFIRKVYKDSSSRSVAYSVNPVVSSNSQSDYN